MQRRERDRREEPQSEFKEKLVAVNRVSKTVKGGRNMRFVALGLGQPDRPPHQPHQRDSGRKEVREVSEWVRKLIRTARALA